VLPKKYRHLCDIPVGIVKDERAYFLPLSLGPRGAVKHVKALEYLTDRDSYPLRVEPGILGGSRELDDPSDIKADAFEIVQPGRQGRQAAIHVRKLADRLPRFVQGDIVNAIQINRL